MTEAFQFAAYCAGFFFAMAGAHEAVKIFTKNIDRKGDDE